MFPKLTPEAAVRELKSAGDDIAEVATDAALAQAQKDLNEAEVRNQKAKYLLEMQNRKRALDEETAKAEQLLKTPPRPQEEKRSRPLGREGDNVEQGPVVSSSEVDEPQASSSGADRPEDQLSVVSEPVVPLEGVDEQNVYQQSLVNGEPVGENEYDPAGSLGREDEGRDLFGGPLFTGSELEAGYESVLMNVQEELDHNESVDTSDNVEPGIQ